MALAEPVAHFLWRVGPGFSRGRGFTFLPRCGLARLAGPHAVPAFRSDGYLPEGVWKASAAEVLFRFGAANSHRRRLPLRLRRWIELAVEVGASRLLVDGSFVTAKHEPGDVDAVILLPAAFDSQIEQGGAAALELETMLLRRHPEEIFAAEDDSDWNEWVAYFSRTREPDGRRKGLVEVEL